MNSSRTVTIILAILFAILLYLLCVATFTRRVGAFERFLYYLAVYLLLFFMLYVFWVFQSTYHYKERFIQWFYILISSWRYRNVHDASTMTEDIEEAYWRFISQPGQSNDPYWK